MRIANVIMSWLIIMPDFHGAGITNNYIGTKHPHLVIIFPPQSRNQPVPIQTNKHYRTVGGRPNPGQATTCTAQGIFSLYLPPSIQYATINHHHDALIIHTPPKKKKREKTQGLAK